MAKKNRTEFFDENAPLNSRGKRINLKTDGQPDEALFQDLVDSTVFFNEDIASDAEAKANSGGAETKVPKVEQLPTVDTDDADIEIAVDGATSTRNNFFVRLSTAFKNAFSTLQGDVSTNTTNISTNAGNITTNTNSISSIQNDGSLAVQKDDATVGTTTSTLNFEGAGVSTVVDEGSNKTTITIAGGGGGGTPTFATGGTVLSGAAVVVGLPAQSVTFTNVTATTVNGMCFLSGKVEAIGASATWSVGQNIAVSMTLQPAYQINASVSSNYTLGTAYVKGSDGGNLNVGSGYPVRISSSQINITCYVEGTNAANTTATFHFNATYPLV